MVSARPIYCFEDFELDLALGELRRNGTAIFLQQKPFELLARLVSTGQIQSKQALMKLVWPDVVVSDAALASALRDLRRALDDDASTPRFIRTYRRKGYRFVAPVSKKVPTEQTRDSSTASPPLESSFVGRHRDLDTLRKAFESALSGQCRIVLQAGAAGVGKTRMAAHFRREAAMHGALTVTGTCSDEEQTRPYWPWIQILRRLLAERDGKLLRSELGTGAMHLDQILGDLRERWPELPEVPRLESAEARFQLFQAVAAFLSICAAPSGLLVVLDDLQSADVSSLRLLEFLSVQLPRARLIVLASFRDSDLTEGCPLRETVGRIEETERGVVAPLRGLTILESRLLLEELTGGTFRTSIVDQVLARTEGNPFFIEEMVRHLRQSETSEPRSSGEAGSLDVPPGVREMIRVRLGHLERSCREVLELAAAIGRGFSVAMISAVSGIGESELLRRLKPALRTDLIVVVKTKNKIPSRLRFSHPLIHEAVYAELGPLERMRQHRRIGDELENFYRSSIELHLPEIARHFFESAADGRAEQAVDYSTQAGERAMRTLAFEEATAHFRRAISTLDLVLTPRAGDRCDLLIHLGHALRFVGQHESAGASFVRAAAIARQLDHGWRLARAAAGFAGEPHAYFANARTVDLLEEALASLEATDSSLRVRILVLLAGHLYSSMKLERVDALVEEGVDRARRCADPTALALALATQTWIQRGRSSPESCLAMATEALMIAESAGDPTTAAWASLYRIRCWLELGDLAQVTSEIDRLERRVEERRIVSIEHAVVGIRAVLAQLDGRFSDAEVLGQRAHELARQVRYPPADPVHGARVGWLLRERGRLGLFAPTAHQIAEKNPDLLNYRCALALVTASSGDFDRSRAALDGLSEDGFDSASRDPDWLVNLCLLAEASFVMRDSTHAKSLYERLLSERRLCVVSGDAQTVFGSVSLYLGMLAIVLGDRVAAERHSLDALSLHLSMGSPPLIARTHAVLAVSYSRGNSALDRKCAQKSIHAAEDLAERFELHGVSAILSSLKS